jgi:hypothetical protein
LLVSPEVTARDGSTTSQYRSIPFCYLEDLFQEEFWRYFVKKWGAEALRIYPVTEGRIVRRKDGELQDWKLLSVPKEHPQWVTKARNIDSSRLASLLTTDDQMAFKIAQGRIRRADKVVEVVNAEKRKISLRQSQEHSPQSIREQRVQVQKKILGIHKYQCRIRAENADRFFRSSDINTVEYKQAREGLIEQNRMDRAEAMEWKDVALDEDIAKGFQKIFDRYEKIKAIIVPEYGQKLKAPREDTCSDRTADEWEALVKKAHGFFKGNDIPEAMKICWEITEDVDAPNRTVAEAHLLLARKSGQYRLWNAQQAVQMFELIRQNSGTEFDEHINGKLDAARAHLQKARNESQTKRLGTVTSTKVQPADSINTVQPLSSGMKVKDGPKVQVPGQENSLAQHTDSTERVEEGISTQADPTYLRIAQPEQAEAMEGATETEGTGNIEAPETPHTYGWRPKGRPGMDVLTPKEKAQMDLYNKAHAARQKGNFPTSEQIFLTLLQMKNLNARTKAMCHVQLATMAHRTDQMDQARRAQLIFRQLELAQPESERAASDRKSADGLVRAVERAEWEKERKASSGLMLGLWRLFRRKRKRGGGGDGAVDGEGERAFGDGGEEAGRDGGADAMVDLFEEYPSPKKARFS